MSKRLLTLRPGDLLSLSVIDMRLAKWPGEPLTILNSEYTFELALFPSLLGSHRLGSWTWT